MLNSFAIHIGPGTVDCYTSHPDREALFNYQASIHSHPLPCTRDLLFRLAILIMRGKGYNILCSFCIPNIV